MKGIILAGGLGTRLYPTTLSTCKQLLPIFDKPMIYYPPAVLMQAGIKDILVISTPHDKNRFQALLGNGHQLGISLSYAHQEKPEGIAQSFIIAEDFIGKDNVALILGDNIFYGHDLAGFLKKGLIFHQHALIFGYEVSDPGRHGVLRFDERQRVIGIIERPKDPPSSYAVTGLYFFDHQVVEIAKTLKPSWRNEYEITDVNQIYLERGLLKVCFFDRGFVWLDTGTPDAFHKASSYVQTIQERQGIKIGCIEEIAFQMGYIDLQQLDDLAEFYAASEYGKYLQKIASKYRESWSINTLLV